MLYQLIIIDLFGINLDNHGDNISHLYGGWTLQIGIKNFRKIII
jgi:hypothetical protein